MKFGLDIKNKKAEFDSDAEKLIEKGMDIHEKSWKDKFTTKHTAKKEMLELKHQQKLEIDDKKLEQLIKLKELELEEKKMQEENERRKVRPKIIASCILGIIGTIFVVIGLLQGTTEAREPFEIVGFFFYIPIAYIWLFSLTQNKK